MWLRLPLWYDIVVVTPPTVLLYAAGSLLGRPSRLLVAGAGTAVASVIFRFLFEVRHNGPVTWTGRIEFGALQVAATWFLAMIPLALGGLLGFRPQAPKRALLPLALRIVALGMVVMLAFGIVLLVGCLLIILRVNSGR
jgi:hypothetical protein